MEPTTVGMALSTKIILGIVGLAVVGGVGYSVVTNDSASTNENPDADNTANEEMFSGDIFGLVGRGGDWKCTWSYNQDGVDSSGTVWVSGENFKSEAKVVANGVDMSAQAIGDGEYMYSWTSAMPNGMKFKIDEAQKMSSEPSVSGQAAAQAEQFGQDYNYDCEKWNADRKTFEVPSNITFTDFSAMMQGAFDTQGGSGSANVDIEALMKQYQQ